MAKSHVVVMKTHPHSAAFASPSANSSSAAADDALEDGFSVSHRSQNGSSSIFEVCRLGRGRCTVIATPRCPLHGPPKAAKSALRVALVFAGAFRALDVTHKSLENAVLPSLSATVSTFYFLAAPLKRCGDRVFKNEPSSQARCDEVHERPRDEGVNARWHVGGWEGITDAFVVEWALRSCATELRYSTHAEVVGPDEKICNPIDAMQWLKVQRAFAMVTDYEQRLKKTGRAARFDWIIRLRTDLIFFGPLPSLGQLSTQYVHVPMGVVSRRTLLNDHIALVPRTLAHAYFDTVDELKCNRTAMLVERTLLGTDGSERGQDADGVLLRLPPCASNVARQPAHPASNGTGCTQIHERIVQDQSGARLLASRLKYAFGKDVIKHNIGYTLLRSTTGAECSRLKNSPITEASWWAACLNLTRLGIPVFCLEAPSNASAVASAATRLIGRPYDAFCIGTCHTWSPRCEQLPVRPSPLAWPLSPHHFSTKNSVNLSATSRWVPYMPHKPPAWPAMAFTPSVDWMSRVDSVDDDVHSGLV